MEFVDLHVHSTASDGSFSPGELVEMALETGLYAFALTDHDTVAGIPYALEAAQGQPIHVIPGVEISAQIGVREVHVLGYNIDWENDLLNSTLEKVAQLRYERNDQMCGLLKEQGMDITMDELYKISGSSVITRGDMARLMTEKRYVSSVAEAFEKYIGDDGPCYLPRFKLDITDVYTLITHAGGICSLAHPVKYKLKDEEYLQLFEYLKKLGFRCIEAIHSDHSVKDEKLYKDIADYLGLKITGGSDFHGASKPDIFMGTGRGNLKIPRSILSNINLQL